MTPGEFEFISALLRCRSGLDLTQDKIYLLESRLLPVARSHGHADLASLIRMLRLRQEETVIDAVVDAMTTNESMFFRDQKPFAQLRQLILPHLLRRGSKALRIWSAACATGQEPYSIAMSLFEEEKALASLAWEIHATDISPRVLDKAARGIYSQLEVQRGMPIQMLLRYFNRLPDSTWQACGKLRERITFARQNLFSDVSALGEFDIIFCRNVLIYFSESARREVLGNLARRLTQGGVLVLGNAESHFDLTGSLHMLGGEHGIYTLAAPDTPL